MIIVKKKHRIATRHPTEVRGDVLIIIRRNGAKTVSLQALFVKLNYADLKHCSDSTVLRT
jgi:hypothetical protein